jgi:cytoskeletal protein RodZ
MTGRRDQPSTQDAVKPKGFDDFDVRLGDLMRGERATLGKSLLDVQRELKIKATQIAAIENCDVSAFETQGFIAGYVRSYARYLGMDPEWAYAKFCDEAGFRTAHGMSPSASNPRMGSAAMARRKSEHADPLANPRASFVPRGESTFSRIEPGALGSLLVLAALTGAIAFGGWTVLQEVQRVQLAPVDSPPSGVVATLDPLSGATTLPEVAAVDSGLALPSPEALDRLYRPQALDVPVMVSRDGPIAAIDPRRTGVMAGDRAQVAELEEPVPDPAEIQVVEAGPPTVELFAVRPAWVRVQAADGTTLFEKILDANERYEVPQMEEPPVLRAGNSGSVYFLVNGETYGPSAPGAQIARNVVLSAESLSEVYEVADIESDADLARFVVALAEE